MTTNAGDKLIPPVDELISCGAELEMAPDRCNALERALLDE